MLFRRKNGNVNAFQYWCTVYSVYWCIVTVKYNAISLLIYVFTVNPCRKKINKFINNTNTYLLHGAESFLRS